MSHHRNLYLNSFDQSAISGLASLCFLVFSDILSVISHHSSNFPSPVSLPTFPISSQSSLVAYFKPVSRIISFFCCFWSLNAQIYWPKHSHRPCRRPHSSSKSVLQIMLILPGPGLFHKNVCLFLPHNWYQYNIEQANIKSV